MPNDTLEWRVCDAAEFERVRLALVHRDGSEGVVASVEAHYGTGTTRATIVQYQDTEAYGDLANSTPRAVDGWRAGQSGAGPSTGA
jgi:hypothetical protein